MSPIYTSGAFLQQCFSVHPLCLTIKKLVGPEHLILSCTACQLSHRLTVRSLTTHLPGQDEPKEDQGGEAFEYLKSCSEAHGKALGISRMDVVQDAAGLRCTECRRIFHLEVSKFETHQR